MPLISIVSPWGGFSDSNIAWTQHTGTGRTESNVMIRRIALHGKHVAAAIAVMLLSAGAQARAAGCPSKPQGEGRVAAVIDARTFRLDDGREVRLAGIEPSSPDRTRAAAALSAIIGGRDVTLHGEDDTPDRYGRQPAFVFLAGSETPVQSELLRRGRGAGLDRSDRQGLRRWPGGRRGRGAAGQKGNLGRSGGHKKRGKSRRYFGRDWALYGGRGQGFVRPAGRGNDLPEFRTELDTGLCCDYFKAHDAGVRGGRTWA